MENWSGRIEQHIADTTMSASLGFNRETRLYHSVTDLDGDRFTDLLADVSDPLRAYGIRF